MHFAEKEYDAIIRKHKIYSSKPKLQGEFDLVLSNSDSVLIIEIEYQANQYHMEQLLKKGVVFRQLYPEYSNHDLYLGLAAFHFDSKTEKKSIEHGIAVIKQEGNTMVINDVHLMGL